MRRLRLLALFALALPTAASASTIQLFSISNAQFLSGLNSLITVNFAPTWQVSVRGSVSPIGLLTIRTLGVTTLTSGCMSSPGSCTFSDT